MNDADVLRFRQIAALIKDNADLVGDLIARVKLLADSGDKKNPYGDAYLGIMEFVCCFQTKPGIVADARRSPSTAISHQFKSFGVFSGEPRGVETWGPPYIAWLFWNDENSSRAFLSRIREALPRITVPEYKRVAAQFSFDAPGSVLEAIQLRQSASIQNEKAVSVIASKASSLFQRFFDSGISKIRAIRSLQSQAREFQLEAREAINQFTTHAKAGRETERDYKKVLKKAYVSSVELNKNFQSISHAFDDDIRKQIFMRSNAFEQEVLKLIGSDYTGASDAIESGLLLQEEIINSSEEQVIRLFSST